MGSLRALSLAVNSLVLYLVLSQVLLLIYAATDLGDVNALNALRRQWGPKTSELKWDGDPCLDSWTGVRCDSINARVTSLSLDGRNLAGPLPREIGDLGELETLELSVNPELTGPLPKELGKLRRLRILSLQWCGFTGPLPAEIGNLVDLTFLGVNGNNLTGELPDSLGKLNRVDWLDISENLFSGPMPMSTTSASGFGLDNMTGVEHFHFNNNSLSGSIPPEIFVLPRLIHLILDHNNFTGQIPPEIADSNSLRIIRMDYNKLEGSIPAEVGRLPNITDLNFAHNKLTGALPNLSNLTKLQSLDVSENEFADQSFPSWMLRFPALQTLIMRRSNLVGQLPSSAFKLARIETIDLRSNQINGSLIFTDTISSSLNTLILDENKIDGFIGEPRSGDGKTLSLDISLHNNPLCESSYFEPRGLVCLQYSPDNALADRNRDCSRTCDRRKVLNVKDCTCAYPLTLNLSLTAPSFATIDQTRLSNLETELATKITLRDEYKVDLDPNQVYIENPRYSPDNRISLDVQFFPKVGDALSSEEQDDIIHSLRQHKINLSVGPYNVPSDSFSDFAGGITLSVVAIALIATGAVVAFLALIGLIFYAVRQRRITKRTKNPFASWGEGGKSHKHGAAPKLRSVRPFSVAELKAATNNWREVLGEGGYGKVYRGTLKNGDIIAIKRASKGSMQGLAEFKNELELLSRVHHRNLVNLVGFCYESGEQALVYEYMPNGTLRERLYERVEVPMSWEVRFEIILDSARGLAYLHDHADPPIIHGDIKSANILLDPKMVAKVADFGLSKPTDFEGGKMLWSDEIKGTRGYLDPEYFQTHIHTDKSDVFSFGVVMVEALTGRSPTDGGKDRTREIKNARETGGTTAVRELLDPIVRSIVDKDLDWYLSLALRCTAELGENRPTMTEVVKDLEALVGKDKITSGYHKIDITGEKSPEVYSDRIQLVNSNPSHERGSEGNSFQYSGAYGVTATIEPK